MTIINEATYVESRDLPNRLTYAKNQYDPHLISNRIYLVDKAGDLQLFINELGDIDGIDDGGAVAVPGTMSGVLDLLVTYFYA